MKRRNVVWYDVAGIHREGADDHLSQLDVIFMKTDQTLSPTTELH